MEIQPEKVYVAIGTDWHDGFSTLQWTLRKWPNQGIRIVILHAADTICKDYVYTPLGKLPTSSVSEEKLKILEKAEEANRDKVLSTYIAFCGKVEAEVIKLEKNEQPIHIQILETVSSHHITRLVMSFAFMKATSWKSRTAISGSYYVLRNKPDFCEVFVVCGGRLVSLGEGNEEGLVEDDRGFTLATLKEKNHSIRNWFGKMFAESAANSSPVSPSSSRSNDLPNQWEKCSQEIEHYVSELLSLQEDEGETNGVNAVLKGNSTELSILENIDPAERIQILKRRIQDAQDKIQLNRKQANTAKERREKADRVITICKTRAEELETCLNEQRVKNTDLNKELDSRKDEVIELQSEIGEKRRKLNSILELQKELSDKLCLSSSAKVRSELQLDKAVKTRAHMVQEIEELRKQRDVLQRRIEFCKEKDAISQVPKMNAFGSDFREFSASEITAATEDFSERLRLKSGCQWNNIYKGRINHIKVAIKVYDSANEQSLEAFRTKVKLLSQIRHPNVLAMIGFCSQLNCIAYEFMHNGSLSNALFSTERSCKRKTQPLSWHARIRIAAEICSVLGFLHKTKPKPLIHGDLKPSKILVDRNNIAKIYDLKSPMSYDKPDINLDIRAFGNLVLHLLTGKKSIGTMDCSSLDYSGGEWPMDLATELCGVAIRCLSENEEPVKAMPVREINDIRARADQLVMNDELTSPVEETVCAEEYSNIPSAFLCPIYQDIMHNPHIAADGFSYELEAINEWLRTGHGTSPMTNLRLKHKILMPNHTLRCLIEDWKK